MRRALPHAMLRVAAMIGSAAMLVASAIAGAQDAKQPAGPSFVPAEWAARNTAIITIHGEITRVTAQSVARRMTLAERAGADAIVFELNTPGGEISAVLDISRRVKAWSVGPTVAWVNDQAFSGGAIIAVACRWIVASPSAAMGDAYPIQIGPTGPQPIAPDLRKKVLPPLLGDAVDSARRNGFDEFIVQGMIVDDLELWYVEEISPAPGESPRRLAINESEYRTLFTNEPPRGRPLIVGGGASVRASEGVTSGLQATGDAPAPKLPDGPQDFTPASEGLRALQAEVTLNIGKPSERPTLDTSQRGRWRLVPGKEYLCDGSLPIVLQGSQLEGLGFTVGTISTDAELATFMGAQNLLRLDQSWSEALVAFLTNWIVRGVLIAVFLIATFIEMTHPGLILPGAIALLALGALLGPPFLIDLAAWWEIAAILAGIVLIAVEIFVIPGFTVCGVLGLIAFSVGLVGTFLPDGGYFPDTPGQQRDLLHGVSALFLALVTTGFAVYFISKHFGSLPVLNRLILRNVDPADFERHGDPMLAAMATLTGDEIVVGSQGVTTTPLRPAGRAEFAGRIVDVVAEIGYIDAGERVRVTEVGGLRVTVTRAAPNA